MTDWKRPGIPLWIAAVFAFLWAVARACVQSITMDEAGTYLTFAGRTEPFHWFPAANNHVLNSALMRLFTSVFGVSHLTVRLPALLGAAIYIGGCVFICAWIHRNVFVRVLLFVCLVYNPFVFDFLVAARGYGLASAFLIWAVAMPAVGVLRKASPIRMCAVCSTFVALSFAANFSFAFADFAVLLMIFLWICRSTGFSPRLLAAAILPGAAVTVLLPLSTLLHWPSGQFTEGVMSLRETFGSVIHWSWYELNPEVANPLVYRIMRRIEHPLLWAIAGVVLGKAALLILYRRQPAPELEDNDRNRWLASLATVLAGALVLATAAHWLAFRIFGLLLPANRTALFYVPLFTLFVAVIAIIPVESRMKRGFNRAVATVFSLVALHFILSMRLTYFGEWQYEADVASVYSKLASYNHTNCVTQVGSDWLYSTSLNFYRVLSGRENFAPFEPGLPLPPDAPAYVLHSSIDRDFIGAQNLTVAYRGDSTDVVIAVRPERLAPRGADGSCP